MEESTQSTESADIESFFNMVEDAPAQTEEAPQAEPAKEEAPVEEKKSPSVEDLDEFTKQQRAIWRERKKMADEKAKLDAEKKEIERLQKNPKELLNMKDAKSVDDIISRLFDEEQEKPKNTNKDPEELYAEIEAKVLAKIEAQQKEKEESTMVESERREFYSGIEQFVKEEGKYALVEGMGEAKLVGQVIEAQYQQDVETYGPEKALEMMMSPSDAAQRVEKHLAEQIDMVLKSEKVREFVSKRLGVATGAPKEQTGQQSNQAQLSNATLNNDDYAAPSDGGVVDANLTDEEALNRALKLIP